jgi:uncharacterized protein YqeY
MSEVTNTLEPRIDADLKQAMRDRNEVAKLTLRSVKTALTLAKTSGAQHGLSDDDVLGILQKEVKKRRETAAEFERLGDADRAAAELTEAAVIQGYLPRQLSESELEAIAARAVAASGATSVKEIGKVMPLIMAETKGMADGKVVNQIVRRLLGG